MILEVLVELHIPQKYNRTYNSRILLKNDVGDILNKYVSVSRVDGSVNDECDTVTIKASTSDYSKPVDDFVNSLNQLAVVALHNKIFNIDGLLILANKIDFIIDKKDIEFVNINDTSLILKYAFTGDMLKLCEDMLNKIKAEVDDVGINKDITFLPVDNDTSEVSLNTRNIDVIFNNLCDKLGTMDAEMIKQYNANRVYANYNKDFIINVKNIYNSTSNYAQKLIIVGMLTGFLPGSSRESNFLLGLTYINNITK